MEEEAREEGAAGQSGGTATGNARTEWAGCKAYHFCGSVMRLGFPGRLCSAAGCLLCYSVP